MSSHKRKCRGAYYTPEPVVSSLVRWAARSDTDRLLDPACGDGRFLTIHANSVGVEQDPDAARIVHSVAAGALIHQGDFFSWASVTRERFECAAGNPPFIRYQRFGGEVRKAALNLCAKNGARLSGLTSSWAPFIIATASLLKPGGRMAFVVPAEIGHAPYAKPVLEYLVGHFGRVHLVAVQRKIFSDISEDCWLLFADGFGSKTEHIMLSSRIRFGAMEKPPAVGVKVSVRDWHCWNCRLRPFLMPGDLRDIYREVADDPRTSSLGEFAEVHIGYVTGDNGFFHLRPSEAVRAGIPEKLLQPTVRKGKSLSDGAITTAKVEGWRRSDQPNFLLHIRPNEEIPRTVRRYLDSEAGQKARTAYKCRNRSPWYVVPVVIVPDAFLAYMSSGEPALVANPAGCAATNSVHTVTLKRRVPIHQLQAAWNTPFARLSCEIEGHPLGGGMLKLEPREAARVLLPRRRFKSSEDRRLIAGGIATMREWRHCG